MAEEVKTNNDVAPIRKLSELPSETPLLCEWSPYAPERMHTAKEIRDALDDGYHERYKKLKFFIAKKNVLAITESDVRDIVEEFVVQNDGYPGMEDDIIADVDETEMGKFKDAVNSILSKHPVYRIPDEDAVPVEIDL